MKTIPLPKFALSYHLTQETEPDSKWSGLKKDMEWSEERQTFSKMNRMCRVLRSNHNKWVGSIKGRNFMNSKDYCPVKKDSTHIVVQRISNEGQRLK